VVTKLGYLDNSIGKQETISIQQEELTSFSDANQIGLSSAQPEGDDTEVVGLAAAINRDGETRQFVGATADDARVSEVHEEVRAYARRFTEEMSGEQVQSNVTADGDWSKFSDNIYKNLGVSVDITSDSNTFVWEGRTDYDRWGTHNTLKASPEDGDYISDHLQCCQMYHDWSNYGGNDLAIVSNEPSSSSNNAEVGLNLSLSSAPGGSVGFSYTQYGDVNRTLKQDPYVSKYDWAFKDFDFGEDVSEFDTGTEIAAAPNSIGLQDPLVRFDGNVDVLYDGDKSSYNFNQFFEVSG
jgi:hypothetical protein